MAVPQTSFRSCIVVALALLGAPTHAVSIDPFSTPGAIGWTDHGASIKIWQRKCDRALQRLDKSKPDTGAYVQFQLQRDRYCGSEAVTPHAPSVLDPIVSLPPIFTSTPTATQADAALVSPSPVPEPDTFALLGLGLMGLVLTRKRGTA